MSKKRIIDFDAASSIDTSDYLLMDSATNGTHKIQASSFGSLHNYSTDEHIVGMWIDGSTLYEKTLKWTGDIMLSDSTWTTIPFSEIPSNMDYVQAVSFVTDCVYDNRTRIKYENNLLKAATSQSYGQNISNIVITIQYTKTTA